jgi:predicted phosphoadenosine phosphosulfate sulfurtransferase
MTTDYVDQTLSENLDILEIYRCCVSVTTCTSMLLETLEQSKKKNLWVSPLPKDCLQENDFDFTKKICGTIISRKNCNGFDKKTS